MKYRVRKFVDHLLRETGGAEIAEAAAVLPLMFMVLLGIFWFGQAFSMYGAITRAAQDGVRAGSAPLCTTCTTTQPNYTLYAAAASTAVNNALATANLNPTLAQSPTPPSYTSCAGEVSLNCGSSGPCVQLPVQLLTSAQGGGDCGISVYFQYPFTFWLPFTSVNKQQILLTASASARMETN